jgi:hypothetical protein
LLLVCLWSCPTVTQPLSVLTAALLAVTGTGRNEEALKLWCALYIAPIQTELSCPAVSCFCLPELQKLPFLLL